ncbi:MAG: hypothetical protein AAF533_29140, partial [Acidobacteriota bacterium]
VERASAGTFLTSDAGASWQSRRTLLAGPGSVLAGDETLLVRAAPDRFERSFDAGATWERLAGGPTWNTVKALALVPGGGPIVALEPRAAWVSDDVGATWTRLPESWSTHRSAESLAASLGSTGELVLLVGLEDSRELHRWDGSTGAWTTTAVGFGFGGVTALAVSADGVEAGAWALAGEQANRAFRSRDGGTTWTELTALDPYNLFSLAAHPTEPDHLLVGSRDLLRRSRDGGESWEPLLSMARSWIGSVAFGSGDTLIAAALSSAWWSDDDGVTWRDVTAGLDRGIVRRLEVGAPNEGDEVVFTGARQGGLETLVRQVGRDGAWEDIDHPEVLSLRAIAGHPNEPGSFLTNSGSSRLYRTRDAGVTWEAITPAAVIGVASQLGLNPTEPDNVLLRAGHQVHRSVDGGLSWEEGTGLDGLYLLEDVVQDREQPSRWVAVAREITSVTHSLRESLDGGATWTLSSVPLPVTPFPIFRIAIEHVAGERLLAFVYPASGSSGSKLWLHDPALGGWVDVDPGLPAERPYWWTPVAVASDPGDPEALVLATTGLGIWRSRDGGQTWASWNLGPDAESFDVQTDLIRHRPASIDGPAEVLVGTTNGAWSLSLDESDLLLRVSRAGDDVVLEWPEPRLPVTAMRTEDPTAPLRAVAPGTIGRTVLDPVATDGRLYFYRARH